MTPGNQKNSGDESSEEFIRLKLVDQDSYEIMYRCRMSTVLIKLKRDYSKRVGVPLNCLWLLFAGRRISDDETPKRLEMENYDVIEVHREPASSKKKKYT